jgi:purine-binding chemotaxis protein CheW
MAELMKFNKRKTQVSEGATQVEVRNQFLAFTLGGESFAMDTRWVKEVIQFTGLTEVPLMPPFIRGVLNLRDSVVPVIDLSVRFGKPPTETARRTCVVILEIPRREDRAILGIMVDNVSEVLELSEHDIEPAPAFGNRLHSEFIQGVGKIGGKFIIVLNVQQVLSDEEMDALAPEHEAS